MNTRKGILAALMALLALLMAISPAFAASPHFLSASAAVDNSGNLVVSWKEAGLGNNVIIAYLASADATADYGCINGGGNHPKASNKQTVSGPVSAPGEFSSGKNGAINGSLTVAPPPAGSFSCPSGQTLVLADVAYTNVSITDTTNVIYEPIPGTFSKTFFLFK